MPCSPARRHRGGHRGNRTRGREHQANRKHGDRPPYITQIPPGQFLAGRVQQWRQHDEADHVWRHPDRGDARQQAHHQPGYHQQGGSRESQPLGKSRDHSGQDNEEENSLDTAHAADLASSIYG